jgi:hypothetical protein
MIESFVSWSDKHTFVREMVVAANNSHSGLPKKTANVHYKFSPATALVGYSWASRLRKGSGSKQISMTFRLRKSETNLLEFHGAASEARNIRRIRSGPC